MCCRRVLSVAADLLRETKGRESTCGKVHRNGLGWVSAAIQALQRRKQSVLMTFTKVEQQFLFTAWRCLPQHPLKGGEHPDYTPQMTLLSKQLFSHCSFKNCSTCMHFLGQYFSHFQIISNVQCQAELQPPTSNLWITTSSLDVCQARGEVPGRAKGSDGAWEPLATGSLQSKCIFRHEQ